MQERVRGLGTGTCLVLLLTGLTAVATPAQAVAARCPASTMVTGGDSIDGKSTRVLSVRAMTCPAAKAVVAASGGNIATRGAYQKGGTYFLGRFTCRITAVSARGRAKARCTLSRRSFVIAYGGVGAALASRAATPPSGRRSASSEGAAASSNRDRPENSRPGSTADLRRVRATLRAVLVTRGERAARRQCYSVAGVRRSTVDRRFLGAFVSFSQRPRCGEDRSFSFQGYWFQRRDGRIVYRYGVNQAVCFRNSPVPLRVQRDLIRASPVRSCGGIVAPWER